MDCNRFNIVGEHSLHEPHRPLMDIHVLVVDDDTTTLSLVSAMLRILRYKVMSVKNPLDALATLRTQKGLIDLVVTDFHMPYMNGFQLQEQIDKEFQLPVIMMSADDRETVLLRSAQSGMALFILKPVSPNDLKNVWQYAIKYKKGKSVVVIEEIDDSVSNCDMVMNNDQGQISLMDTVVIHMKDSSGSIVAPGKEMVLFDEPNNNNIIGSSSDDVGIVGTLVRKNYGKGDSSSTGNGTGIDVDGNTTADGSNKPPTHERDDYQERRKGPKKTKVVWTNSLQNRFLLAIRHLSLDKAVPKKILDFMNVPGLTRENVASHLQKYRLFLKKVSEKGLLNMTATQAMTDRMFRSSFAAGYPQALTLKNFEASGWNNRTPFSPLQASSIPNNYNINIIHHNIHPASSSLLPSSVVSYNPSDLSTENNNFPPQSNYILNNNDYHQEASSSRRSIQFPQATRIDHSSFIIHNRAPQPTTTYDVVQRHPIIPTYGHSVYQTNHSPVTFGGAFTIASPSNPTANNSDGYIVATGAANNPYGLLNSNANYSNGFVHSAGLFNGTVLPDRPDCTLAVGSMTRSFMNSTNNDAPYCNYINEAANSINGISIGMDSTQMDNVRASPSLAGVYSNQMINGGTPCSSVGVYTTEMNNNSAARILAGMNNGDTVGSSIGMHSNQMINSGVTGSLVEMYSSQMNNGSAASTSSLVGMNNGNAISSSAGMYSNQMFNNDTTGRSVGISSLVGMDNSGTTDSLTGMNSNHLYGSGNQMINYGSIGSTVGMLPTQVINGGGQQPTKFVNSGYGSYMNGVSTNTNIAGYPQTSHFEAGSLPSNHDGFGSTSNTRVNPSPVQPLVSPISVNYLHQQNTRNYYMQPSSVVAPLPPPSLPPQPSPSQQQCTFELQNLGREGYSNVGNDYMVDDQVINNSDSNNICDVVSNKGTSATFGGQIPVASVIGDDILDQLNDISPPNFQAEVVNPQPANLVKNQNPVADPFSANSSCPSLAQENEAPAINNNGQSLRQKDRGVLSNPNSFLPSEDYFPVFDEFQQEGMGEVLDLTDQFLNFPTHVLNEMDWDEVMDKMLDDN